MNGDDKKEQFMKKTAYWYFVVWFMINFFATQAFVFVITNVKETTIAWIQYSLIFAMYFMSSFMLFMRFYDEQERHLNPVSVESLKQINTKLEVLG